MAVPCRGPLHCSLAPLGALKTKSRSGGERSRSCLTNGKKSQSNGLDWEEGPGWQRPKDIADREWGRRGSLKSGLALSPVLEAVSPCTAGEGIENRARPEAQ